MVFVRALDHFASIVPLVYGFGSLAFRVCVLLCKWRGARLCSHWFFPVIPLQIRKDCQRSTPAPGLHLRASVMLA